MVKLFISTLFLSFNCLANVGIISSEQVNQLIEKSKNKSDLVVLDTRGGYKDYFRGHLPNAQHINFDTLRGTDKGVPVQYLPDHLTKELLTRAGVHKNKTHILYAEGGSGDEILSATMVAYVLEKFGVQDIKILDGGYPDFKSRFGVTQEYPQTSVGQLPTVAAKNIGIDVKTLMNLKEKKDVVLVDARPLDEYLGKDDVWLRKGHIPGAISFPWRNLVTEQNAHKFKSPAEVEAMLAKGGITPDKEVIVYCGTSREGSLIRFYLKHLAKFPKVRLYEGSWKEYSSLKDLPTETAPAKAKVTL